MVFLFHHQGEKFNEVRPHTFFTGDLDLYTIVLVKEWISPNWCFGCMLDPVKWRHQCQLMGTKCTIESRKVLYKKKTFSFQGWIATGKRGWVNVNLVQSHGE